MRKLIAVDVDGTLVNSDKEITPRTRHALISAMKAGHAVMIVSGRPPYGLRHQAKELDFDKFGGLLSAYNGGLLYDVKKDELIANHTLDLDLAREILAFSKDLDLELILTKDEYIYTDRADGPYIKYESKAVDMEVKEVKDIRDKLQFAPNKILFAQDPEKIAPESEKLLKKFGDRVVQVKSTRFFHEMMPAGLSKGNSILEACEIFGIAPKDVIVFGDEMNDVTMFEVAGTGVAMDNAVDPIKDMADFVTKSNNEDGIAYYLENFLENKEDK